MPPASTDAWMLDPQLDRDTVAAGDLPLCRVLVMNDVTYPWLILVPRRAAAREFIDLDEAARGQLMVEMTLTSQALRGITDCDKLNVAAIGNVVAQLHIHVVARFRADPAWPKPVWGAGPPKPYAPDAMTGFIAGLRAALPLEDQRPS